MTLIAVTGLKAEAKLAAGADTHVLGGGGDGEGLRAALEQTIAQTLARGGTSGIISFGIAGGLAPGLSAGTVFVGRRIFGETGSIFDTDPSWSRRLAQALGGALIADFAGVDLPVATPQAKAALHRGTGAVAVDMESHLAAEAAAKAGIPFAALRVIADPAERALPHAATVGMKPDGSMAFGAVLASLARNPAQIGALLRTAFDARAAFAALRKSSRIELHP
ncbi:hypothetical protein [Beijerinckia indica]|uniref:Nucleoside phosphorylase domain-containing protein n=1 Tax=Beijerinckia indica subsp. indica (strain ATCC 9039 / DSM 1715 / NCIMB 8712) TaxID=395963 RepID=B2ICC1_BEII9|nr:hypothetical protein [Beijerinckia indica]ACB96718.1 conserved hypothetical protein [Beijerinckia indica subsp. indica ATCC 9039]